MSISIVRSLNVLNCCVKFYTANSVKFIQKFQALGSQRGSQKIMKSKIARECASISVLPYNISTMVQIKVLCISGGFSGLNCNTVRLFSASLVSRYEYFPRQFDP